MSCMFYQTQARYQFAFFKLYKYARYVSAIKFTIYLINLRRLIIFLFYHTFLYQMVKGNIMKKSNFLYPTGSKLSW